MSEEQISTRVSFVVCKTLFVSPSLFHPWPFSPLCVVDSEVLLIHDVVMGLALPQRTVHPDALGHYIM